MVLRLYIESGNTECGLRLCVTKMIFILQDEPFVLKRADGKYEGLAIDIYDKVVSELMKDEIRLELDMVEVGNYGSKLEDGTWTGVFGELLVSVGRDEWVVCMRWNGWMVGVEMCEREEPSHK